MSRFQVLSDAPWLLIEEMLPRPTGRKGRPFSDARTMVEAIIYRYRCGIAGVTCPRCSGRGRRCGCGITGWPLTAPGTGCWRS
jgi:transposase